MFQRTGAAECCQGKSEQEASTMYLAMIWRRVKRPGCSIQPQDHTAESGRDGKICELMGKSMVVKAMFTKDMAGLLFFSLPGHDVPYHRLRTKEAFLHGLGVWKLFPLSSNSQEQHAS